MCAAGVFLVAAFWRRTPPFDPGRRRLLAAARAVTFAAPFAATGYGVFIERNRFRVREVDVPVHGLAPDLNGLRLVQLSDIHFGQFLNRTELETIVAMANETKANLALVTGDLITSRGDNLDECLRLVSKLRADAGVLGCLGNHEIYADAEDYATEKAASLGLDILRRRGRTLRFGDGLLHIAGVDHQPSDQPYLTGADKLLLGGNGVTNVLLSHNPDVFPVAASQGWDLTLSGHTHGGQISVEILSEHLNPARFFTPFIYGLYQRDRATIYVTRGIGTVGVPARIGAPPEVALLRLCAISS
jgi:predicted MPP superfamily phosphohydrolase